MQKELGSYKIWIIFTFCLLFYNLHGYANDKITLAYIDSLSYIQYINGDWEALIQTGKTAKQHKIHFKLLSQRMGYAHFIKKQYYHSLHHYEQALKYDKEDEITCLYLFYNGINLGRMNYARYHAKHFSKEDLPYFHQQKFRWVDAVDLEYSYKIPESQLIHHAAFRRIGINSQIGHQFSLYQTSSFFNQSTDTTQTRQFEYNLSASWNPCAKTNLNISYHYLGAEVDYFVENETYPYSYPAHAFYTHVAQQIKRYDLAISGALFDNKRINSKQVGIRAGINFSGNQLLNFTSSYYRIFENGLNHENQDYKDNLGIFKQSVGMMFWNRVWTEGFVCLGNLNYFIDNNGLYVYNALDNTTFRSGLSAFYYLSSPLTLYFNYTFDQKSTYISNQKYHQHSLTGGIIWKI